jgi:hypothetical protein
MYCCCWYSPAQSREIQDSGTRMYIPQEQGGTDIPPSTEFSFRRLLRLAGVRWRYSIPPPHGTFKQLKLKLIYDRQSVGQFVLVSGAHLGPVTNFSLPLKFPLDSCWFVVLYRPLWREDVSVIYCTIASGPCQSSHSWVEVPQNSRPYFTVSYETPPTWRVRFPYLYPLELGGPGTGFPFFRLLRLAGTTWRYSNPPPDGYSNS